jgi:hypothetical protein
MDELLELDKKTLASVFNSELSTFLKELEQIFKVESDCAESAAKIKAYKKKLNSGLMINATIGVEVFSNYILSEENSEFCNEIKTRNYDHFIHLSNKLDTSNPFLDIIVIIKDVFMKLHDDKKCSIFEYLENLCMVSNVYASK